MPALAKGALTFGCLNNVKKLNDAVLKLWARVLIATAPSKLVLHLPAGDLRRNMLAVLAHNGVDLERIVCLGVQTREDYLLTYHRIDVCLDPFPYNGGTTSLEAWWMGVPVITLLGSTAPGRGVQESLWGSHAPSTARGVRSGNSATRSSVLSEI